MVPGLGRSSGEGNGSPLQYSCLENPMDRGAWQAIARGVARVRHALATKEREREKHSAFIVGFISVIITSTPRQISRH